MADLLPSVSSLGRKKPTAFLRLNSKAPRLGGLVKIKSTVTDSGNGLTRSSYLRPGLVLVKLTSDGLYYRADGVTGDRCLPAVVTSLLGDSATWGGVQLDFTVDGGVLFSVTTAGGDDTVAKVAITLNADARFKGQLIASTGGGKLIVKTLGAGAHRSLLCNAAALATAWGASGLIAQGSDADYRVLGETGGIEEWVDMLDNTGTAFNAAGRTLLAGDFVLANLVGTTTATGFVEALMVLARRGSSFA